MDPDWLPEHLRHVSFSVASARLAGVPDWRLRDERLASLTRASRSLPTPQTLTELAAAFLVAMSGDVALSHVTAARLWGLPLPRTLEARADLDVTRDTRGGQVRRPGCRGHRGLESRSVWQLRGLPVTSLPDTWCDLAAVTRPRLTVDDLVVLGDAVVCRLAGAVVEHTWAESVTEASAYAIHPEPLRGRPPTAGRADTVRRSTSSDGYWRREFARAGRSGSPRPSRSSGRACVRRWSHGAG